jgi:NADH dehydrogenase
VALGRLQDPRAEFRGASAPRAKAATKPADKPATRDARPTPSVTSRG